METARYRLELTPEGAVSRLYDKANGREVIAPGALGNDLQLFQDGPEGEDAWNVHKTATMRRYPFDAETKVEVIESGPVRGVVRVTRRRRASLLEQDIVVYAKSPRIDFVTRVDWQERQTMLKVAFPVAIRSTHATYEIQFGAVERSTHHNTSWDEEKFEVCGHRWADLSETGYGVSLLNDCKYGHDTYENVLRLTLLRGTISPDPGADLGKHEFTYSLLPHSGRWSEGGTVERAWELNVPARSIPVLPGADAPAFGRVLEIDGPAIVETLKAAEDGRGLILRVYEPYGSRGEVSVKLGLPIESVTCCNALEEDSGQDLPLSNGAFSFSIAPFQIKTFRLLTTTPAGRVTSAP
jgi:alpha-mannosidase